MGLQFQATYGKPLVAARDSKCSAKDAEAGVLAMEALHKQVFFLFFFHLSMRAFADDGWKSITFLIFQRF